MKKTILVSADSGETRVAVLEAKTKEQKPEVAELYVERRGRRSIVGNIYKGKVDNVLPGMEAAFVDIGLERNGFLHVDEIVLPGGEAAPRRGRGRGRRINELIKSGQEIIVQVVKDPLKTKGARLSMNISIAGRYLVYAPQGSGVGVSRRLADSERERLRKMVDRTYKGPGGLIVRTAAHGAKKADFVREIDYLHKLNEVLERRTKSAKAPALVFQEADLPVRVLRDVFLSDFEKAIIDSQKQFDRVTSFFQRTAPELVSGVELYKGQEAAVREVGDRGGDPLDPAAPGRPALGRLSDDRLRRGADRDRRQQRQLHRPRQGRPGGDDHPGQHRGRRGGRAAAADARHRRDHRHRLHRHGPQPQPREGAEDAAQGARRRQVEELRGRGLAAGPGRDDAPERHRRGARDPHRPLPDLRRGGRGPLRGDGGAGGAAQAARAGRRGDRSPRPS